MLAGRDKFLFVGSEGVGKKKIVDLVVKSLNCVGDFSETCECQNCKRKENFRGFLKIDCEEDSSIAKVRKLIEASKENLPGVEQKVVLIDNADLLSSRAEDLFLKDFEENEDILYFMIAKTAKNIRSTIISRLTMIKFSELTKEQFNEVIWGFPEISSLDEELANRISEVSGKSPAKFRRYAQGEILEMNRLVNDVWTSVQKVLLVMKNLRDTKEKRLKKIKAQFLIDWIRIRLFEISLRNWKLGRDSFLIFAGAYEDYCQQVDYIDSESGKSFYYVDVIVRYWLQELIRCK